MSFVTPEVLSRLGTLTYSDADHCPFGIVRLDAMGMITLCNRQAAELLGIKPSEAEGRGFFSEIAPGADNPVFRGRFESGLAAGSMNQGFHYALFHRERVQLLEVHLIHHRSSQTSWVFMQARRSATEPWRDIMNSFEEQLAALYAEKRANRSPVVPPMEMPTAPAPAFTAAEGDAALLAEVARLTAEKRVLEGEIQTIRRKAREIAAAMFEAALFGKKVTLAPERAAGVTPIDRKKTG